MFEHFTIAPYGRKDCGAPALHGLRHEVLDYEDDLVAYVDTLVK